MLALAVETATDLAGVALADEAGTRAVSSDRRGRRHGETVAPAIDDVCRRAGVTPGDLELLCVDVGPGLFTGLRVGLATVATMAMALDLPLVGVGSLEVLATAAVRHRLVDDGERLLAVVDARRGEVFAQLFEARGEDAAALGQDERLDPESLVRRVTAAGAGPWCVGDGAWRHRQLLADGGAKVAAQELAHPDPEVLAAVGLARAAAGAAVAGGQIRAHYRRDADVRINWERRNAESRSPVGKVL